MLAELFNYWGVMDVLFDYITLNISGGGQVQVAQH